MLPKAELAGTFCDSDVAHAADYRVSFNGDLWLVRDLKLSSNKRAIVLLSFALSMGEYSATTAANAKAAGPLTVESTADASDTNAWPSIRKIAVARTFFMSFDHHYVAWSWANSVLASFKSAVSKPSVNQL